MQRFITQTSGQVKIIPGPVLVGSPMFTSTSMNILNAPIVIWFTIGKQKQQFSLFALGQPGRLLCNYCSETGDHNIFTSWHLSKGTFEGFYGFIPTCLTRKYHDFD